MYQLILSYMLINCYYILKCRVTNPHAENWNKAATIMTYPRWWMELVSSLFMYSYIKYDCAHLVMHDGEF